MYEVTVRAYDGRVYGAHDVTVTVTSVNEAPVITTKSRREFSLRENSTSTIYTYRATDQDEDDVITWSVEGADGGDFAIYNGMVTFRLLPDLENPVDADEDNVYEITVVAADRAGLRDAVDAVITITDQSEGPVIAGTRAYTVEENYDIAQVLGSYTATDAKDNRPVFPRWSLSGRDGGRLLHQRGRRAHLQEHPRLRPAGRLQPGQRVRGDGAGPRQPGLRQPERDGDRHTCQRARPGGHGPGRP